MRVEIVSFTFVLPHDVEKMRQFLQEKLGAEVDYRQDGSCRCEDISQAVCTLHNIPAHLRYNADALEDLFLDIQSAITDCSGIGIVIVKESKEAQVATAA